jgi:hypothetical protein
MKADTRMSSESVIDYAVVMVRGNRGEKKSPIPQSPLCRMKDAIAIKSRSWETLESP